MLPKLCPDFDLIEKLWADVKMKVFEIEQSNNSGTWTTLKQAWYSNSLEKR